MQPNSPMKNETLSDSTLLESALQTLRSISRATTFTDNDGDKMIMASYSDFAGAEVKLIESKLRLRKSEESLKELQDDMSARTTEQIARDEEAMSERE